MRVEREGERNRAGQAVNAGIDNLRSSADFESLVNIYKLRGENVTPLPLAGEPR